MAQNQEYGFPTSEANPDQAGTRRGNGSDASEQAGGTAMRESLSNAKQKLSDTMAAAQDRSRQVMDTTSDYIQRWPFGAIAIAAGVGLVVGMMIGRSTSNPSLISAARRNWM